MNPEAWLRWGGPVLSAIAIFMPALTATAPLMPPQHWSAFDVCRAAVHAAPSSSNRPDQQISLRDLLKQVEEIRRQFARRQGAGVPAEFKLAALLPVMLIVGAVAALLVLVATLARWWRVANFSAAAGALASAYVLLAAWLLTRAVQREVATAFERGRHDLHAWASLGSALAADLGLHAEAALYLMLLAFLSVLLVPRPKAAEKAVA